MTKRIIAALILISVSASVTLAGFPRSSLERLVRVRRADVTFVYNFGTEWELTEDTEAGRTITLPLPSGFTYDFIIDWGDGTQGSVTAHDDANRIHTYATIGRKTVKIAGVLGGWRFANAGDRLKFRAVTDWGTDTGFTGAGFSQAWYGCANAESFATPVPYYDVTTLVNAWFGCSSLTNAPDVNALTKVTSLNSTWYNCSSLTNASDVNALTKVTSLNGTWFGCSSLTNAPDVNALTNVTTLAYTWFGCSSLTTASDVNALTNVTTLDQAWRGCSSLTNAPDVNALTKVTSLNGTWLGCSSLTTAPDVNALTNVTTLVNAWRGCSSLTNAPDVNALTKVTSLNGTWLGCSSLKTVPVLSAASTALTTTAEAFRYIGSGMTGTVVAIWNAMEVAGFSDGNQKYHRNGDVEGKRAYRHNDLKIEWDGVDKWEMLDGATVLYESTDDVATPDLVTTWTAVNGGATIGTVTVGPFPNVTSFANTFTGATGLNNYADIPNAWKGL